ncbi:MAG TPA: translesion DNA synthesis-associated protein ImuA [Oxalicibacterium sp.]
MSSLPVPLSLPDAVWRGDQMGSCRSQTMPSGHAALDSELPGNGWPSSALTELLLADHGIGEWRLLAPALSSLTATGKKLILLAPPYTLHAGALHALGIRLNNILLIAANKQNDRVWAAEQVLKSASFGALLCWFPQIRNEHLRRLQLAATGCEGLTFVFRPSTAQEQSSPAPLRLVCQPAQMGRLSVDIVKRRGPVLGTPLVLPLSIPHTLVRPLAEAHAASLSSSPSHAVDRASFSATSARRSTALSV